MEDNTSKVPTRVLTYIFSFLPVNDLGKIATVSKKFKKASNEDGCWKHFGVENKAEYIDIRNRLLSIEKGLGDGEDTPPTL